MYCQKCGTEIANDAVACPRCGASVAAPPPATVAAEKMRTATKDAFQAFKLLGSNPVGHLPAAFESLGESRALGVGIIFGAVFALCVLVTAYRLLPEWGRPHAFFVKLLVAALVPFIGLVGAGAIVRKAFRGAGGVGADSFIAGASCLPTGCIVLLASILGLGNIEVVGLITLFGICLTILMLFAALTRIYRLSERHATFAVPVMLIGSAWLSKVIYSALL